MFLVLLLLIILALEVKSNNKYSKEIQSCYRLLIHQEQRIKELEAKLKIE
jgi:hypothetical protein